MASKEEFLPEEHQQPGSPFSKDAFIMSTEKKELSRSGASGLVFVGCLMLGLAVGLLAGNVAVGLIGGLGVGFIGMAITRAVTGAW